MNQKFKFQDDFSKLLTKIETIVETNSSPVRSRDGARVNTNKQASIGEKIQTNNKKSMKFPDIVG